MMYLIGDIQGTLLYTCLSVVIFQLFYRVISPYLSKLLISDHFNKLTKSQKVQWNCGSCSIVNGFLVVALSSATFFEGKIIQDKLWGFSDWIPLNAYVCLGYFISDFQIMTSNLNDSGGSFALLGHHVTCIACFLTVMISRNLGFFVTLRTFAEASQPFLQLRWCLSVCGMKQSKSYIVNGILLTSLFFITRICVLPIYYYYAVMSFGTESFELLPNAVVGIWLPCSIGSDLLNIYWFVLMMKGLIKFLKKANTKDE